MKVGLTFGGYCPLHQGHLDCIFQAKKECDKVFVVVCGYDNEPRAEEIGLSHKQRLHMIEDFFKGDEIINVFGVNDTVLGIDDESMSMDNWKIWLNDVLNKIYSRTDGLRFDVDEENPINVYVGDPAYEQDLNILHDEHGYFVKPVLVGVDKNGNPRKNNISATDIRKNPIRYWNKIAAPFRPYLTKRILITGTASEGKTTMVQDLAKYFNCPCTTEFGRDYMSDFHMTDYDLTYNDFVNFLFGQNRYYNDALKAQNNNGVIISDTDNLVTLMYAKAYSRNDEMQITKDDYKDLHDMVGRINKDITWDKIFVLPPRNKFVDDGCRYMGQASMDQRNMNFDNLMQLIEEFGLMDKVEVLFSDFNGNFNKVKEYIQGLYE